MARACLRGDLVEFRHLTRAMSHRLRSLVNQAEAVRDKRMSRAMVRRDLI